MERFDSVLLSLAQQCEGGVPELLDIVFGFMNRKTDFYSGGLESGKAKKMVLDAFSKHAASAEAELVKKKARLAEMDRKQKERREKEKKKEAELEKQQQNGMDVLIFVYRGCLIIIWTGLNIKIGIVQKVYE